MKVVIPDIRYAKSGMTTLLFGIAQVAHVGSLLHGRNRGGGVSADLGDCPRDQMKVVIPDLAERVLGIQASDSLRSKTMQNRQRPWPEAFCIVFDTADSETWIPDTRRFAPLAHEVGNDDP
jgi:hypothetical protein